LIPALVPEINYMKMYMFPPSSRVTAFVALKLHLSLDWETVAVDLGRGDQRAPGYSALKRPDSGMWPSELKAQADVLRWPFWESAHWDAESIGMVVFEKRSKGVLGLDAPDPAFVARGEQNFARFAAVLNDSLRGKTWLVGEEVTIADFSVGGLVPSAQGFGFTAGLEASPGGKAGGSHFLDGQ
jgi:glutathione S-transferase